MLCFICQNTHLAKFLAALGSQTMSQQGRSLHCYLSRCVFVLVGNAASNLCHVYRYPESFGNFSYLLALPVLNTAPRTRCFLLRWWSRAGVLAQEEQVISDTSLAQAPPASPPLSFVPLKHKHT